MASSTAGKKVEYSTLSVPTTEPVVSVDWLHSNLREPDLKVVLFGLFFFFLFYSSYSGGVR